MTWKMPPQAYVPTKARRACAAMQEAVAATNADIHVRPFLGARLKLLKFNEGLCTVLVLASLVACGDTKKEAAKAQAAVERRNSFENITLPEAAPLADGGVYATSLFGPTWYVQGASAVKVTALPEDISEIVPTVDGGAYAITMSNGIWRLDKATAIRVVESSELPPSDKSQTLNGRERALFAFWQDEISKRKAAENEPPEGYGDDRE